MKKIDIIVIIVITINFLMTIVGNNVHSLIGWALVLLLFLNRLEDKKRIDKE